MLFFSKDKIPNLNLFLNTGETPQNTIIQSSLSGETDGCIEYSWVVGQDPDNTTYTDESVMYKLILASYTDFSVRDVVSGISISK